MEQLEDQPFPVQTTAREQIHSGRVWNVIAETFRYNDASITRELIDHPGAVAVLALDEDDRVLLIRQYRHPIRAKDWEIPAGLLDGPGESPLVAAQRELAEEADLAAARWDLLAEFYTSPGGSNECIRIYLARGLSAVAAFTRTDEEADIEVRWVPLAEAVQAVLTRRIQSPSTVIGVLSAHSAQQDGWRTLGPADAPWPRHPKLGTGSW